MSTATHVGDLLARELRRDAARPFVTWYDVATGARVELSVATTANWTAKIAGHVTDEHGAEPGVTIALPGSLHWVTVVLLLGVWATGAAVSFDGDADAVIDVVPDPMGVGLSRLVGAQPDVFMPVVPPHPDAAALVLGGPTWTHAELTAAALDGARAHDLEATARVLSTLPLDTTVGLDAGLVVPLAAGGSVVLVEGGDASAHARIAATENVTHTAGADVDALPRLG